MKVTIDKNELYLDPEIIVKCKEIDDILQDIIAFLIAYKSRRKEFIKDTKGLITKKDGLIYHGYRIGTGIGCAIDRSTP